MHCENCVTAGRFWCICQNTKFNILSNTILFLSWMHPFEIVYTGQSHSRCFIWFRKNFFMYFSLRRDSKFKHQIVKCRLWFQSPDVFLVLQCPNTSRNQQKVIIWSKHCMNAKLFHFSRFFWTFPCQIFDTMSRKGYTMN